MVVTGDARVTGILTIGTSSIIINGNDDTITATKFSGNLETNAGISTFQNLTASGTIGINGAAAQTPLDLISNSSGYGIALRGRSSDNAGRMRFTSNDYASIYSELISTPSSFSININGSTEALRITSGGKLGVNTDAISAQLEVRSAASTINTVTIKTSAGAGGYAGLAFMAGQSTAGREKAAIYFQETNNGPHYTGDIVFALNNDSGSAVQVGTSDERLRITSNGNVGIGTDNPTEKLDVAGTVKATSFEGDGSNLTGISTSQSLSVLLRTGFSTSIPLFSGTLTIIGRSGNVNVNV